MLFTRSANRKAALTFVFAALLSPISVNGQSCGDTSGHRLFRPFRSGGSCTEAAPANTTAADAAPANAAPANAAPANAAPADAGIPAQPTMFAAPAPTGEIAGGRSSIALPSFRLSLPRISVETPELCVHGFTKFRRDPHMMIDGAAAPASYNHPLLFGQLAGASAQQTQFGARPATAAPAAAAPAAAAPATAAPAAREEGCTSIESQRIQDLARQILELQKLASQSSPGSRTGTRTAPTLPGHAGVMTVSAKNNLSHNSAEFQLQACEQQVAGLESQIVELQKLVEQLAARNVPESQSAPKSSASHVQPSRAVDPWRREQETDAAAPESPVAAEQARRIAILEARLEQFEKMNSAGRVAVSDKDGIAEPLIRPEQHQAGKQTANLTSKARISVLDKLGMSLSRR